MSLSHTPTSAHTRLGECRFGVYILGNLKLKSCACLLSAASSAFSTGNMNKWGGFRCMAFPMLQLPVSIMSIGRPSRTDLLNRASGVIEVGLELTLIESEIPSGMEEPSDGVMWPVSLNVSILSMLIVVGLGGSERFFPHQHKRHRLCCSTYNSNCFNILIMTYH